MINSFKNPAIMRILRTTERHGAGWREQNFIPHDEAEPLTGQKSISYKTPHSIDRGVFAKTNVRAFEEAHAILICNGLRGSIHISRL